jgi:hypothetical protein
MPTGRAECGSRFCLALDLGLLRAYRAYEMARGRRSRRIARSTLLERGTLRGNKVFFAIGVARSERLD